MAQGVRSTGVFVQKCGPAGHSRGRKKKFIDVKTTLEKRGQSAFCAIEPRTRQRAKLLLEHYRENLTETYLTQQLRIHRAALHRKRSRMHH